MFVSGSIKAAVELLEKIRPKVEVVESIVIDELCEWKGRQKLDDADIRVTVTPLVRTESVDAVT